MNVAIITAAGKGERARLGKNKNLYDLCGKTVIERTVAAFLSVEEIDLVAVTAARDDLEEFLKILSPLSPKIKVVLGGDTRKQSVFNALEKFPCDVVVIHDGARPFVSAGLIKSCLLTAKKEGSAVAAVPPVNTVGTVEGDLIKGVGRSAFVEIQTPQAFSYADIMVAYNNAAGREDFTDDCGVYLNTFDRCVTVPGERTNLKLTNPEDFRKENFRVGTGFDLHRLTEGRRLILGGVEIPHGKGLLGHSDADALTHALMDGLLSACGLKDIGTYFPDTDPKYKDISSIFLLEKVCEIIKKEGYKPVNVSICIMAERPKLAPYVDKMKAVISQALHLDQRDVGITCTTLEGLGIVGREEGIACQAYCLVNKI